jgi:glycosyltransferase 2 family protein
MKNIIKLTVTISLFILFFYLVDYELLLHAFDKLSFSIIIFLLILSFLMIWISVLKWRLFLSAFGGKVEVIELMRLYTISYFVNAFIPSHVGGDVVRSITIGKQVGQKSAATATFLERYTGLIVMIFLGIVSLFFAENIPFATLSALLILGLIIVVANAILLSPKKIRFLNRLPFIKNKIVKITDLQDQIIKIFHKKDIIVKAILFSLIFHLLAIINIFVICHGIGWYEVPIFKLATVLPLILLISGLPLTPSGIGLQEGAFFYFLHNIGATSEQALAVGVILRAKWVLLAMTGGGLYLINKKSSRA